MARTGDGKFVGIQKPTRIKQFLALDDNDTIVGSLIILGEGEIAKSLMEDELPVEVNPLEQFTCLAYCPSSVPSPDYPMTIPKLRWHLFRSTNAKGENLPPTPGVLLPHITRVNHISMRDKSYTQRSPELPPAEENGFKVIGDTYMPVINLNLPAPKAVIELVKCGCIKGCANRCSCVRNTIPCTPLCKCFYGECSNIERSNDES